MLRGVQPPPRVAQCMTSQHMASEITEAVVSPHNVDFTRVPSDTMPRDVPPGPPEEFHVFSHEIHSNERRGKGNRNHNNPRPPRTAPRSDHWPELQELRSKLAEHEETMGRLRSAFGMISVALGVHQPNGMSVDGDGAFGGWEEPANRPPRLSRGGNNHLNNDRQNPFHSNHDSQPRRGRGRRDAGFHRIQQQG